MWHDTLFDEYLNFIRWKNLLVGKSPGENFFFFFFISNRSKARWCGHTRTARLSDGRMEGNEEKEKENEKKEEVPTADKFYLSNVRRLYLPAFVARQTAINPFYRCCRCK